MKMFEIRCHFQLGENVKAFAIVENTGSRGEVKITIVRNEVADKSFCVNGETMIKAISKCIET